MKTRIKSKLLIAALLVLPVGGFLAQATLAGNASGAPIIDKEFETALRKFVTRRFYNRIDATDEQKEKLNAIFSTAADDTRADREQLRRGLSDLSNLMSSEKATDDDITKKAHELRSLHEKVMDRRLTTALAVRQVLTAEQKDKINSRLQDLITGGVGKTRKIGMMINAVSD